MVVFNPHRRKREAAAEAAQDAFEARCAAIVAGRLSGLGFSRGLPGYSLEPGELQLLFEADGDFFDHEFPGAGGDCAESGGVELWVEFHEQSGEFEANCTAGGFYMDERDASGVTDWREDPAPLLSLLVDRLSAELDRSRDRHADHFDPVTRGFGERRGWEPLQSAGWLRTLLIKRRLRLHDKGKKKF